METKQPIWRECDTFGDGDPIECGGGYIYEDTTGVYPPEAEYIEPVGENSVRIYRFILEPCTLVNGILSDNPEHPEHPAWFAQPESARAERPQDTTYLKDIADCVGVDVDTLEKMFLSGNIMDRCAAWCLVGKYHGWENLDACPVSLGRSEAIARYANPR